MTSETVRLDSFIKCKWLTLNPQKTYQRTKMEPHQRSKQISVRFFRQVMSSHL